MTQLVQDASETRRPGDPYDSAEGKGSANPNEKSMLGRVPLEMRSRA
jgi:hypothetical protein